MSGRFAVGNTEFPFAENWCLQTSDSQVQRHAPTWIFLPILRINSFYCKVSDCSYASAVARCCTTKTSGLLYFRNNSSLWRIIAVWNVARKNFHEAQTLCLTCDPTMSPVILNVFRTKAKTCGPKLRRKVISPSRFVWYALCSSEVICATLLVKCLVRELKWNTSCESSGEVISLSVLVKYSGECSTEEDCASVLVKCFVRVF
jgi:hypothetical protein